jgi:hypothetical protein
MRWSEAGYLSQIVLAHALRQASVSLILNVRQKEMTPETANQLVTALRNIGSRVRINPKNSLPSDWDRPLFSPASGYLETAKSGPYSLLEISSIDIEVEDRRRIGRLTVPVVTNYQLEIEATLLGLGLVYQIEGTFYRVENETKA